MRPDDLGYQVIFAALWFGSGLFMGIGIGGFLVELRKWWHAPGGVVDQVVDQVEQLLPAERAGELVPVPVRDDLAAQIVEQREHAVQPPVNPAGQWNEW